MVEIFKYVDKFFISLTNYLTYNYIFMIFVGLFLFTIICVVIFTSKSYEARLIKAVDKFNSYFIDNPQINEENLVAFNNKMKEKKVPKQLRKNWQQYVLYREDKASTYMSFENCVSTPMKNSTYTRDVKTMNVLAWIFSLCALILNCYYCFETNDIAAALRSVLLTPIIILLLNYIVQIFLNLRHSAIISDLFQNYQYFEVNIDKATETLPEYVDYEVLFDRNEIKKGIPILYTYLQKRAEEEQRELERARLKNVEHEKFNFDDQGIAASLVLERAMQEAENYIAERKKYNQDISQINSDMTQEDMNYREVTKEYNRQMQVSKESFANFKSQLEEVSSTIEANYLKKQQQQELDRQRNLERDFDTATEKHKKVIESYHAELDTVDKFIAQSRKALEDAMKNEFSAYSSKVYDEAKKVAEERIKEKLDKSKTDLIDLEEKLVAKNQELEEAYSQNQEISEKLQVALEQNKELIEKSKSKKSKHEHEVEPQLVPEQAKENKEVKDEIVSQEPIQENSSESNINEQVQENSQQTEEQVQEVKEPTIYSLLEETDFDEDDSDEDKGDENNGEEPISNNGEEVADKLEDSNNEETSVEEEETYRESNNNFVDDFKNEDEFIDDAVSEAIQEDNNDDEKENVDNVVEDEGKLMSEFEENLRRLQELTESLNKTHEDVSTETIDDSIKEEKTVSRRGRPRKVVDTDEEKGEKKRPGRPRKEVAEIKTEQKKGRGRPKKEVKEVETEVKRGRGRPKKSEQEQTKHRGRPRKENTEEITKSKAVVKKGRGRPKKAVENTPSEIKRGRGRPKKAQAPIKKRGRPSNKSQNISNEIKDIDAYLKEIDDAIAAENAKMEETQKELAKKAKLRRKK